MDDLSNWYVRRSRRRFWRGDEGEVEDKRSAYLTLHESLVTVAKLLAPFTPFVADEIYENLDGAEPSVHLCDFPEADEDLMDRELEFDMAVTRRTVELGRAARSQAKVKVRQPLREAVVVADPRERAAIERLEDQVLEELNVKRISYVDEAEELASYEVKPNFRACGPRFGSRMPEVARAIAQLAPRGSDGGRARSGRGHDRGRRLRGAPRAGRSLARDAPARGLSARAPGQLRGRAECSTSTRSCAARAPHAKSCTRSRMPQGRGAPGSRTGST